jgi:hypothetical protein
VLPQHLRSANMSFLIIARMKKYLFLFFSLSFIVALVSCADLQFGIRGKAHSNIMLVLGSSDQKARAERIALACDLIKRKDIHFDKIVLSGGCGAHGTDETNCEATDMKRLLEETGGNSISGILIYKEEKSQSTVQNYCYCRDLKNNDEDLIQKGDTLYVVSSHYHALSVAACFKNDGIDAHYYYTCGDVLYDGIPPSPATVAASTDPCFKDYNGIAQNCGNPDWCKDQANSGMGPPLIPKK